jgi:transcriptional regulator
VATGSTVGGMYIPGPNTVDDPMLTLALLRSAGVGHLVSVDIAGALDSTLLPFVVDDDLGTVRAHFARANPQWRTLDGATVLVIVPVSDAYVSPIWYESKRDDPRVVPTWNYELVHVHGTAHVRDDASFVESVVGSLTDLHEARRVEQPATRQGDPPPRWSVDDAPPEFIARQLRAIVGVEITVTRVEAKRKLSQNRSDADRRGVVGGMSHSSHTHSRRVVDAMRNDLPR